MNFYVTIRGNYFNCRYCKSAEILQKSSQNLAKLTSMDISSEIGNSCYLHSFILFSIFTVMSRNVRVASFLKRVAALSKKSSQAKRKKNNFQNHENSNPGEGEGWGVSSNPLALLLFNDFFISISIYYLLPGRGEG